MKIQNQPKPTHNSGDPSDFRAGGVRANTAKTFEHRYERRKIREQLRGLDRPLSWENEVFA